jgi:hypothetical protein
MGNPENPSSSTTLLTITVMASADQMAHYLEQVVQQYLQGHVSGHLDATTRWHCRPHPQGPVTVTQSIGAGPGIAMATYSVGWTETSRHSTKLRLPATLTAEGLDLENALGSLDHDGLESLQRQIDWIESVPEGDDDHDNTHRGTGATRRP